MSIASLYPSINPSLLLDFANSKVLDPRITFTRTTTATYYDGVTTAKAEENLLTYSQEFDDASWTKGSVTVTANSATTAPDGTTTADLFYPSSTGTWRIIYKSGIKANIQYTLTVYAKASGFSNFFVGFDNQTTTVAWFNLTTGVKGTKGANITSSDMTSVGNGWYRCQVVFTHTSDSFALFGVADADNSSTATASGTNGALIWGAQAEQRSSATAYTATTTQAITNYIPVLQTASAGQARFDHNPTTGESLGLLIEEARTNSLTYSSDFSNAAWTKGNATITANTIVAPDGTLTGDKAVETTTASVSHYIAQNSITVSSGAVVTLSVFAKSGERTRFGLLEPYVNKGSFFDLSNGTVVGNFIGAPTSSSITPVGNGWYRCSITTTASGTTSGFELYTVSTGTTYQYTGDGFSGVFLWGAQLEAGSFATSYIPTVASTVTRNADAASMTGTNFSSWFNNGEGTLYGETESVKGTYPHIAGLQSSSSNNIYFYLQGSAGAYWSALDVVTNGSTQVGINTTTSASTNRKSSTGYKANDFGVVLNGGTVVTDTSGTVPVISQMDIGCRGGTQYFANGCIKKLAYYPIKATSTQLQALTS